MMMSPIEKCYRYSQTSFLTIVACVCLYAAEISMKKVQTTIISKQKHILLRASVFIGVAAISSFILMISLFRPDKALVFRASIALLATASLILMTLVTINVVSPMFE